MAKKDSETIATHDSKGNLTGSLPTAGKTTPTPSAVAQPVVDKTTTVDESDNSVAKALKKFRVTEVHQMIYEIDIEASSAEEAVELAGLESSEMWQETVDGAVRQEAVDLDDENSIPVIVFDETVHYEGRPEDGKSEPAVEDPNNISGQTHYGPYDKTIRSIVDQIKTITPKKALELVVLFRLEFPESWDHPLPAMLHRVTDSKADSLRELVKSAIPSDIRPQDKVAFVSAVQYTLCSVYLRDLWDDTPVFECVVAPWEEVFGGIDFSLDPRVNREEA
jgi:hypothetical protein